MSDSKASARLETKRAEQLRSRLDMSTRNGSVEYSTCQVTVNQASTL